MSDPARWTKVSAIVAAARRRWDDGTLPRAFALDEPFPVIDVPLRGPQASDLGEHFDEARAWAESIERGARGYEVVRGSIGGRIAGATEIPLRAIVDSYKQAWRLLGVGADAEAFRRVVQGSADVGAVRDWALGSPLRAIALADEWTTLLDAYEWLRTHRGSGLYLRQVSAPGVDTKFIERHRSVLAAFLAVPAGTVAFPSALGLATKPLSVRLRFDAGSLGFPLGLTEATLRTEELSRLPVHPRAALLVENEVTYLSVPVPEGGVVIWGRGYDATAAASLVWLEDVPVAYWGDIDTHGFAILHGVRSRLPHARSVLMDRETLLAHDERWGHDANATSASFDRLDPVESTLYSDLVTDRYGPRVQLEQERIDWHWAIQRLTDHWGR